MSRRSHLKTYFEGYRREWSNGMDVLVRLMMLWFLVALVTLPFGLVAELFDPSSEATDGASSGISFALFGTLLLLLGAVAFSLCARGVGLLSESELADDEGDHLDSMKSQQDDGANE